tara:strand:+ start:363 stop:764 length:402 start_codon:yes stop_codon:yes gene_type:complete
MNEKKLDFNELTGIAALLIHAAKIDDNYTDKEKNLISDFLKSFIENEEKIQKIFKNAEDLEKNSNQLITFTNLIKKNSLETKTLIVKQLWKIIISDNSSDDYEANLMRRICGLIYFPDKLSGEVKMQIQKEKS